MSIGTAQLSGASIFTQPLYALEHSTQQIQTSALKLSTGSRITRAGDDVASFSIATRLQSQLSGLKQASSNAAQGDSMLQVASSALQQIMDLLDRNAAIATQANSSSLTTADRSYLQVEFAGNLSEIDRIAGTTSFNGVNLLDGTLSGEGQALTTDTNATKGQATLAFSANPALLSTVVLNGVTFTEGTSFTRGGSTSATIDSLITALNASTNSNITKATYTRNNDSLVITAKAGGKLGNAYTVNQASSTATFVTTGTATQTANIYTLSNGANDGITSGSVVAGGSVGDAIVNTQSQTKGSVTLTMSGNAVATETLNIDDGNGSLLAFSFVASSASSTQITIGSTVEETLQNAVKMFTQYSGTSGYVLNQLDFKIDGNSLVISNKTAGNAFDFTGAVPDITETLTNGTLSASTITGATNTGVDTTGVTNKDFVGEVSGFSATYVGADSVTASITVGDHTYTGAITDTTPSSNTTVRFSSTSGGYFDVQLAASQGQAVVNTETSLDSYASRLDSAFGGLTFYQNRPVSNFAASGAFALGSAELQTDDFTNVRIDNIEVTAPVSSGQDATIDITINGETFRSSSGIRGSMGAYETIKFTSLEDSNKVLTLHNGMTAHDFSSSTLAQTFEDDLRTAFAMNDAAGGLTFQVGTVPANEVRVTVNKATTSTLFNGVTPSVTTQDNAEDAQDLLDTARDTVLEAIANVGALQSRFQSAQNVNAKMIEGLTVARADLADTDIAEESTTYALAALKLNAGISVMAQTHNLQASLLGILQNNRQN